jgi:hypothetical protein
MSLALDRAINAGTLFMIGDNLMCLLMPRGHVNMWKEGPPLWRAVFRPFEGRPGLTRAVAAVALGAFVLLAARQEGRYSEAA